MTRSREVSNLKDAISLFSSEYVLERNKTTCAGFYPSQYFCKGRSIFYLKINLTIDEGILSYLFTLATREEDIQRSVFRGF